MAIEKLRSGPWWDATLKPLRLLEGAARRRQDPTEAVFQHLPSVDSTLGSTPAAPRDPAQGGGDGLGAGLSAMVVSPGAVGISGGGGGGGGVRETGKRGVVKGGKKAEMSAEEMRSLRCGSAL